MDFKTLLIKTYLQEKLMYLNDEKLTQQEKEDILHQQIDKEYKKLRQVRGFEPFKAFWILTYDLLKVLNDDAYENDGIFDFYKEDIDKFDPLMNCIVYEGHRINKGEWDRFYECWSDRDYIRCRVGFFNCLIAGATEDSFAQAKYTLDFEEDEEGSRERIKKYPNSWNIDGTPVSQDKTGGFGIIEFDPSLLDEIQKRCDERNSDLNVKEKIIEDIQFDFTIGKRQQILWNHSEGFDKDVKNRIKNFFKNEATKKNRRQHIGKKKKSKKKLFKSLMGF